MSITYRGYSFFSDFEKAFDSVNHEYMYQCLEHFNFGNDLIHWVKLFYNDAKSCVSNNGSLSDFFKIQRGVRQGCPLSPYLFIICIELLSNKIIKDPDIKGINIAGTEFKTSLFADDAAFIMDGTRKSFETLINIMDNFSYLSGLCLNTNKCQVLRIGSMKLKSIEYLKHRKYLWSSDEAKCLGMIFNTDKQKLFSLNLEPKIKDFEKCLQQWQHRKLTLMGKIVVIKNYALPKLIYPLTSLPNPPRETVKHLENIMFNFLWDGKPDKIKRETITQDYERGGLKMIDIERFILSLKVGWIKRLAQTDNNKLLRKNYESNLMKLGGNIVFESNLNKDDINSIFAKSSFLRDVLLAWNTLSNKAVIYHCGNEILWNNSNIRVEDKPAIFKSWLNVGIKYVKDMFDKGTQSFYTFPALKEKYNLLPSDFLKYLSILNSIPKAWKRQLKMKTKISNQM